MKSPFSLYAKTAPNHKPYFHLHASYVGKMFFGGWKKASKTQTPPVGLMPNYSIVFSFDHNHFSEPFSKSLKNLSGLYVCLPEQGGLAGTARFQSIIAVINCVGPCKDLQDNCVILNGAPDQGPLMAISCLPLIITAPMAVTFLQSPRLMVL